MASQELLGLQNTCSSFVAACILPFPEDGWAGQRGLSGWAFIFTIPHLPLCPFLEKHMHSADILLIMCNKEAMCPMRRKRGADWQQFQKVHERDLFILFLIGETCIIGARWHLMGLWMPSWGQGWYIGCLVSTHRNCRSGSPVAWLLLPNQAGQWMEQEANMWS